MTCRAYKPLIFMLLLVAVSCADEVMDQPGIAGDPQWFDLAAFVEETAAGITATRLEKRVVVKSVAESKTIADIDWAQELEPFAGSTIDRPALWDRYRVDTSRNAAQGWKVSYLATDSSLFTRSLEVSYADTRMPLDTVAAIDVLNRFSSVIADTRQELHYEPGHYRIVSWQDVLLSKPRLLEIEARWESGGR